MNLSLRFEDNGTSHGDMVLRLGDQSCVCDSYYLSLDLGVLPDEEDAEKVKAVLRRLHESWLAAIQKVPDGGSVFLPYDFSDECTGWISCERSGDDVLVSRGWSHLPGYSVSPSSVGVVPGVPGFRIEGPSIRASLEELATAIRGSLLEVV